VELYARYVAPYRWKAGASGLVARESGSARKMVRNLLEYTVPPGYQPQKPVRRPKLRPWQGVIDAMLEDDK